MKNNKRSWAMGVGAFALSAMSAVTFAIDNQEAHTQGQALGNQRLNDVGTSQFTQQNAQQIPFYKENPIQQQSYDGGFGSMLDIGMSRITQSSSYTSGNCDREQFDPQTSAMEAFGPVKWLGMSEAEKNKAITDQIAFFDQECDAINFLADDYGGRVRKEIHPDDELNVWIPDKGESVEAGVCSEQTINIPAEFVVESCHETSSIERRYCRETMNVTCTPQPWDGCSPSGVLPATNSSDTNTALYHMGNGNWHLSFGTIGDDYWNGGRGTVFDRTLTVDIDNVEKITKFDLVRVDFDDWYLLRVNDALVYVGPFSGDRLELETYTKCVNPYQKCVRSSGGDNDYCIKWEEACGSWLPNQLRVKYGPTSYGNPERSQSHSRNLSIDIRPYLKNGKNIIFSRTIVGGYGEMYSEFRVRAKCDPACHYNWVSNCSPFNQVLLR